MDIQITNITIPDHFLTQEICQLAVGELPSLLTDIPERFITRDMCCDAFRRDPRVFWCILNRFKEIQMCEEALAYDPWNFQFVPDYFIPDLYYFLKPWIRVSDDIDQDRKQYFLDIIEDKCEWCGKHKTLMRN